MTKDINYSGLSTVPSDYEAPDGALAVSLNLISEDGHIKPLPQPSVVCTLPVRCSVVFIHKTSAFTHYIIYEDNTDQMGNGETLHWVGEEDIHDGRTVADIIANNSQVVHDYGLHPVEKVISVGNTLEVMCDDGVHYSLWKGDEYKYLGTHMPELPLSFGLQGETKGDDTTSVSEAKHVYLKRNHEVVSFDMPDEGGSLDLENTSAEIDYITEQILARANKFIAEEGTEKGKFIFPFFVRYAYRLYDGNITMHSMPVLMTTNSHLAPEMFIVQTHNPGIVGYDYMYTRLGGLVYDLDYCCISQAAKDTLEDWSDIVKSVDIFISAPIYTYKQSGKVDTIINYAASLKGKTKALIASDESFHCNHDRCASIIFEDLTGRTYAIGFNGGYEFQLPMYSKEEYFEALTSVSNFYFLKSIAIADIATEREVVKVPENYLQSLTSREVMTEDNGSHDTLVPSYMQSLNSRLLMANIEKHLARPLPAVCYTPLYFSVSNHLPVYYDTCVYIYIEKEGQQYVVKTSVSQLGYDLPFDFFYYPDPDAYKALFYHERNGGSVYIGEMDLKKHDFLPGAFCSLLYDPNPSVTQVSSVPEESGDIVVSMPNKIYNSEVNNPFFFPTTGISTVGVGDLVGTATVNEPVSQGQFGYADIYLFSTDGIWVAKIDSEGHIENINPLSRDVCTNPDSIIQLNKSVLFTTARGIMQVSGSKPVCISDMLMDAPIDLSTLPNIDQVAGTFQPSEFSAFLQNCRMLYDYVHQHVVVFNPSLGVNNLPLYNYAYVFSLLSNKWGMMHSTLASAVNSYPEAMAMTHDRKFVDFSSGSIIEGILVSRPIKLGAADIMKSIHTVIHRGMFRRGHISTALYGSRDLYAWHLVASSTEHRLRHLRGTPYKYFRIVVVANLTDDESFTGTSVEFDLRHTNKLR